MKALAWLRAFLSLSLPFFGSMFASLVGLGALLGLTVGLAQVKWNQFHLALDYDSIENDLAHLRFPGMKVVRLGFL